MKIGSLDEEMEMISESHGFVLDDFFAGQNNYRVETTHFAITLVVKTRRCKAGNIAMPIRALFYGCKQDFLLSFSLAS